MGTAPRSLGGRAKQVGKHFGSSALVSLKGSLEFGGFSIAVMGCMLQLAGLLTRIERKFRACVCYVGLVSMRRVEKSPKLSS